jgi:hypothetical protein
MQAIVMTTTTGKTCEHGGVRFSSEYICGVQDGQLYSVIPHVEIERITLHHGALSAHPLIQLVVGAVLGASGIPLLIYLIRWVHSGGLHLYLDAVLTLPAVGVILFFTSLRRGYYLIVEKKRGAVKLAFNSKAQAQGVRALLDQARALVGYPIAIDAGIPR